MLIKVDGQTICTDIDWSARYASGVRFPVDQKGDGFLNVSRSFRSRANETQINERVGESSYFSEPTSCVAFPYPRTWKVQGELPPWRLRRRLIPQPEETPLKVCTIRSCSSELSQDDWERFFSKDQSISLPSGKHRVELQAPCHSTAFLRLLFSTAAHSSLKITYSESYERPPFDNPTFRNKGDRLDSKDAVLTGSCVDLYDQVDLSTLPEVDGARVYEPFWFRTFRFLILEFDVGPDSLLLHQLECKQTNYPLNPKSEWSCDVDDGFSNSVWEVSLRTLRNCVVDGYSDCPFYEQLQYAQDSRSSGLFHYSISGDDRLMRQAIQGFAASVTAEGLIESRYPSHVHQIITGFCLFWILELKDHMLYFNDPSFIRPFFPIAHRILDYFEAHVDARGLVSGLPTNYWSYVDWAVEWVSTEDHPDGGVPFAGRKTNTHTIFSLLYAYALEEASKLVQWLGQPEFATTYQKRRQALLEAVRKHCWNGEYYTDTSLDACTGQHDLSQHVQCFAVLTGAAPPEQHKALLHGAFTTPGFVKMSYAYTHYTLRAFAAAGMYEEMWESVWKPYRQMLANNLSTWEEDDVRHRSDCHAWGSLALYEYPAEVAGVQPLTPGWSTISWNPRTRILARFRAKVTAGRDNVGTVSWDTQSKIATLELEKPCDVMTGDKAHMGMEAKLWQGVTRVELAIP